MTLINLTTLFGGIKPLHSTQAPVNFRGNEKIAVFNHEGPEPIGDGFSTNPFSSNFKSKAEIEQLAKSSPRIMALLKEHNLPLRVNMDALEDMI